MASDVIGKVHEENNLRNSQALYAKDYMLQVSYSVPIDKLYRVLSSCNFDTDLEFCPVLLQIMDDRII